MQTKRRMSRSKLTEGPVTAAPPPATVAERKELVELRFRAGHLRWWETEGRTAVLLIYYQYGKAVYDAVQAGISIEEPASVAQVKESSIRRAKAVGTRPFEWFHEKCMYRSDAGERLTRRHIETLAIATASREKAALAAAKARVGGSRKMEEATRRKKLPQREDLPSEAIEPLSEGPASGTFPSPKGPAKARDRGMDDSGTSSGERSRRGAK
jgi:hypothetical protein